MRMASIILAASVASCSAAVSAQGIPHEGVATICDLEGHCVGLHETARFASEVDCVNALPDMNLALLLYLVNINLYHSVSSASVACVPSGIAS